MRVFAAMLWALMIFALSSVPREGESEEAWPKIPHADKAIHLVLYAGLGFLVFLTAAPQPVRGHLAWVAGAVAIASLYGATDELHQVWVPGRTPSAIDWAFDVLGATAGVLIAARRAPKQYFPGRSMDTCELSDTA